MHQPHPIPTFSAAVGAIMAMLTSMMTRITIIGLAALSISSCGLPDLNLPATGDGADASSTRTEDESGKYASDGAGTTSGTEPDKAEGGGNADAIPAGGDGGQPGSGPEPEPAETGAGGAEGSQANPDGNGEVGADGENNGGDGIVWTRDPPGGVPVSQPVEEDPVDLPAPVPVPPPAPQPAGPATSCYKGDPLVCAVESAIVRLTNDLRGSTRTPLAEHFGMAFVARDWSQKQADRGSISHLGFPAARTSLYRAEFGTSDVPSINAENVAYSSSGSDDAEAIAAMFVRMWSNSLGHRRNMMGNYQLLGAGVARRGSYWYATQIFGQ